MKFTQTTTNSIEFCRDCHNVAGRRRTVCPWFMNQIRARWTSRVNKGGDLRLFHRERRATFGSVTRSHYASEHFLTRYPALIICLASAPETYGFIAKYARATKLGPRGKNLISTSCSVLRRAPKFRGTNGCVRKTRGGHSAAVP